MVDFAEKLSVDLVEQFREQPNIEALAAVIARQLQDVFTFYEQLRTERDVHTAEGKQLDGVGNIVDLTRAQAGLLSGDPIPYDVMDDDKYRKFLIWKILKNTSHTTYPDIIKAFKMFWDRPMIFDTGEMESAKDAVVDTSPLFDTPLIRAAGVTLKLYARTRTPLDPAIVGIAPGLGYAMTETGLPELEREIDYSSKVHIAALLSTVTQDGLPIVELDYRFKSEVHAGAAMQSTATDKLPAVDREIDYNAVVQSGSAADSVMVTPIGDVELRE